MYLGRIRLALGGGVTSPFSIRPQVIKSNVYILIRALESALHLPRFFFGFNKILLE